MNKKTSKPFPNNKLELGLVEMNYVALYKKGKTRLKKGEPSYVNKREKN